MPLAKVNIFYSLKVSLVEYINVWIHGFYSRISSHIKDICLDFYLEFPKGKKDHVSPQNPVSVDGHGPTSIISLLVKVPTIILCVLWLSTMFHHPHNYSSLIIKILTPCTWMNAHISNYLQGHWRMPPTSWWRLTLHSIRMRHAQSWGKWPPARSGEPLLVAYPTVFVTASTKNISHRG